VKGGRVAMITSQGDPFCSFFCDVMLRAHPWLYFLASLMTVFDDTAFSNIFILCVDFSSRMPSDSIGGSIGWRDVQCPNGGDYGHHMSKAAANMGSVCSSPHSIGKASCITGTASHMVKLL
jgi:hypothetical protein